MKNRNLLFWIVVTLIIGGTFSCKDKDELAIPVELKVGTTLMNFNAEGGLFSTNINATYEWSAEVSPSDNESWCKIEPVADSLKVTLEPNRDTLIRTTKIIITTGNEADSKSSYIDIIQGAADRAAIGFSQSKVIFTPDQKEVRKVSVYSNSKEISWKWCGDTVVDWMEQVKYEGIELILQAKAYADREVRKAALLVTCGVEGNQFSDTLFIEQSGNAPYIRFSVDTLFLDYTGKAKSIEVLFNTPNYEHPLDGGVYTKWWNYKLLESTPNKDTYEISTEPYFASEDRVTPMNFFCDIPDKQIEIYTRFYLYQYAAPKASIKVEKNNIGFGTAATKEVLKVTSSFENYTFEVDADWCTIVKNATGLEIAVSESTSENPRIAHLTINCGGGTNLAQAKVTIVQLGTKPTIALSTDKITLNENGDEQRVSVTTNQKNWMVEYDVNNGWCTVVEDQENSCIKISATKADIGTRTLVIKVVGGDSEKIETQLTVSQTLAYRVGDLYMIDEKPVGIVYEVSEDGLHGKAFALAANEQCNLHFSEGLFYNPKEPDDPKNVMPVAYSFDDGKANMEAYKNTGADWKKHYPAAGYVDDLNKDGQTGWYLPAIDEINEMIYFANGHKVVAQGEDPTPEVIAERERINKLISDNGGTPLMWELPADDFLVMKEYMISSTETFFQSYPMYYHVMLRTNWAFPTHRDIGDPTDFMSGTGVIRAFIAF